jgi:hypothetical protein
MAAVFCGLVVSAMADRPNPYQAIIDRNVFALKPPPPPPDPSQDVPPPAPLATVKLTGITSLFSKKKALLEITPAPGKPPVKPILEEGDRAEGVEVMTIDMDKNQVALKIGGLMTNITFEVAKSTPAAASPGLPAAPVLGRPGLTPAAAPPPPPPETSALITPPTSSASGRGSIVLMGGNAAEPVAPAANPAVPPAAARFPRSAEGFRSIPSRQIRTPQAQPQAQAQTAIDSYINMESLRHEQQQHGGGPPLPPTPLTPLVEGDQSGAEVPAYRGPPRLPRRLPPFPGQQ